MSTPTPADPRPVVAVCGATGLVGRTMVHVLHEREFPFREFRPMASARSAGTELTIDGRTYPVVEATPEAFDGVDVALFSAGGTVARTLAPEAARRGCTVVDNSSAWRMEPGIPLVVAGVNDDDAAGHEGIVANPNCSTMQLMPLFMALRDAVGLERVIVDTYQAVGGTGEKAVDELEAQMRPTSRARRRRPASTRTRSPSMRSPRSTSSSTTGTPRRSGRSSPRAARSCTCRTSPCRARRCACRSSWATRRPSTSRRAIPIGPVEARALFAATPGVVVVDEPA